MGISKYYISILIYDRINLLARRAKSPILILIYVHRFVVQNIFMEIVIIIIEAVFITVHVRFSVFNKITRDVDLLHLIREYI